MVRMDKKKLMDLVNLKVKESHHEKLAKKFGLTKDKFSKVIHNERKLYFSEFLEMAYEFNFLTPHLPYTTTKEVFRQIDDDILIELFNERFLTSRKLRALAYKYYEEESKKPASHQDVALQYLRLSTIQDYKSPKITSNSIHE